MLTRTPEEERILLEHDDKAMIENPQLWPHWGVLPVKNPRLYSKTEALAGLGLIYEGCQTRVVLGCLFLLNQNAPSVDYGSVDALIADGWQVD